MKFSCIAAYLRNALSATERLIERNVSLPILQCVRLETQKGRIIISATNLEIGVRASFQAKIESEGVIAVPGRVLGSILSYVRDEKISLELSDDRMLTMIAGSYHTSMKTSDPSEFPIIPTIERGFTAHFEGTDFSDALASLVFLAAPGDVRPELGGVFASFEGTQARLAATDSFRLGERTIKIPGKEHPEKTQCIVPTRSVAEFLRVFSESSAVNVRVNENQILFTSPERELVSLLVEGKYPDYEAIIPLSFTTTVHLKNDDFSQALRAASVFCGKNKEVRVMFNPAEKRCTIESKNGDIGTYAADIPCQGKGNNLTLACNYQYFLDALGKLKDESVTVSGNKDTDPLLLQNATSLGTRYLIMPLRSY